MAKIVKRITLAVLVIILLYGISYCWRAFPIISGYGAKMLCSCTMLAGREPNDVIAKELGRFPLSLGSFEANFNDSSATGRVFGMALQKAIYRKGLGCTLINGISEDDLRAQKYNIVSPPLLDPDTIPWPQGNLLPDSLPLGIEYKKLNDVVEEAFAEPGPDTLRQTRAVLVLYDGAIVLEKYAPGFDRNSSMIGWSMTKSVTNALMGILVKKGKLDIRQPAPITPWKNDERSKITLSNLMHASSGLRWVEDYSSPSSATNMLFKEKNMGLYASECPAHYDPETVFYYSSGTTNILSWIIRQSIGEEDYYSFPSRELFNKIGIRTMVIEPDAGGTFVGSSYSFATARDWARFGLLYLNRGNWQGEQILSPEWIEYTVTPAPAAPLGQYGAQFWLNAGAKEDHTKRYYPDVPEDLFWADGYEGQNVFILPSKKLVVVKLSLSQGDYLDDNQFLSGIISTLPQK